MNRKQFMSIPKRDWKEELHGVTGVLVMPSRRKHDSGWACMDFVASIENGKKLIGFGGPCDDVSFYGYHFRMDCDFESKLIHIWNSKGPFTVSSGISSINFEEEQNEQPTKHRRNR